MFQPSKISGAIFLGGFREGNQKKMGQTKTKNITLDELGFLGVAPILSVIFKNPPLTLDDAKTTIEVAELLLGSFHQRFTRLVYVAWRVCWNNEEFVGAVTGEQKCASVLHVCSIVCEQWI